MHISAHHLQIELGRYTKPTTPLERRFCRYCYTEPNSLDTEFHFLFQCGTFELKRQCFLGKLSALGIIINNEWPDNLKISKVLCPTSVQAAKLVNKYISIMETSRSKIDEGTPPNYLGHRNPIVLDYENVEPTDSDCSFSLSTISSDFFESSFEE